MAHADTSHLKWYKTRTAISGLLLLAFGVLYIGVILPIANVSAPLNYRFPFSFETNIYVTVLALLGIHWFYRLARPASVSPRTNPVGKLDVLNMIFKSVFCLVVGGSYLTGAMVASPEVFAPITSIPMVGPSVVIFANYLHTTFAGLLVAFGLAIIALELIKIFAVKQGTLGDWLFKARYRESKIVYWILGISVIIQGTLGMFLAGTFSSIGPYGLFGLNSYSFESLVRHIHGPFGAFVFITFFAAVYLRARPEFSIR